MPSPNVFGDVSLSPEQLDDKYNPDGDGEHPRFTREAWRQAVVQEETLRGYWDWVAVQVWETATEFPE